MNDPILCWKPYGWRSHLMSELVAGSAQNHQPLISIAAVELVHLCVIPDRCASKRRHIFNKHNFPFERRKIQEVP